jgi:hypothetical protein
VVYAAAVVLIIGALLARGHRTPFIAALGISATIIAVNWSVCTSSDREAGGVGSADSDFPKYLITRRRRRGGNARY